MFCELKCVVFFFVKRCFVSFKTICILFVSLILSFSSEITLFIVKEGLEVDCCIKKIYNFAPSKTKADKKVFNRLWKTTEKGNVQIKN